MSTYAPTVVDAVVWPDETAAFLAVGPPGADAVAPLAVLDPARLSPVGRVDVLVAIERQLAWLAAQQQQVLAVMAAADRSVDRWVTEEVACALRVAPVTAQARLAVAADLVGRLPGTLAAVESGGLTMLHARLLAEATGRLDAEIAQAVETRVLAQAAEQTPSEFRRSVRRAVAACTTATADERHRAAAEQRRVCVTAQDDGMAELWALLPADGAAAVYAAVHALASVTSTDDERTADQRRADALVDLGVAALHDPQLPRAQGSRPSVQVTVALSTLLGLDDAPAELAGHGPIPAGLARRIAADTTGTWRRLLTDPADGRLLDYGRTTYRPPADLADYVIARDRTCLFPGCSRTAHRCDLDDRVPYQHGGTTTPDNLHALCRRHHRAKHLASWLPQIADSRTMWTSPTGHRYASTPEPLPRDSTVGTDRDPPPY